MFVKSETMKSIWKQNVEVIDDIRILVKECVDAGMIDVAKKYCDILLELRSISGNIVGSRNR